YGEGNIDGVFLICFKFIDHVLILNLGKRISEPAITSPGLKSGAPTPRSRVSARLPASLASCADPNGQLRCSGEGHECARQAKAASLRRVARASRSRVR